MTKNSEAIRLAEASDWKGLQRLIEKAPEYAQERGDYGMLPIHWACTESHVPLALLSRLLTAYPHGAKIKNDAELLPLHIAIRARVEPEWLERLLAVYPHAVHVDAPDCVTVMDLANQVGLHTDGLKLLRHAYENLLSHDSKIFDHHCGGDHPELDDWEPLARESVLASVTPIDSELPLTFGRGSSGNNNTPVSPAHSLMNDDTDDDHPDTIVDHRVLHSPPRTRLVSTFSSPSSDGSANTAPIPRTAPSLLMQQNSFHRKHSLDYHAHAAAAALATRQHHEMMMARGVNGRSMSMLGGRHSSLPVVPSFEHIRFNYPYEHRQPTRESQSSDDESDGHADNNDVYRYRSSSLRTSGGGGRKTKKKRATTPNGGRSFESPPEWKRADECSICRASFGMFKHRHHCRNCGKSICSQHSADKKILMEAKGFTTPQRVCVTCYAMITHKQSKEASHQFDAMPHHGPKISGPVAAFHQQIQQQQLQGGRSTGGTGVSSPGSMGNASARSSGSTTGHATGNHSHGGSNSMASDKGQDMWLVQAHVNELRHVVASQQKQIEQLTQTNMQMQQQILEQEELKAETMLLITQLMTRVSVLELTNHGTDNQEDQSDDEDD